MGEEISLFEYVSAPFNYSAEKNKFAKGDLNLVKTRIYLSRIQALTLA